MDTKLLDRIQRAIFVFLALGLLWLLFAPKSYGQFSRPVWQPKDPCSEPIYRWVKKGVKYKEVQLPDSLNVPAEKRNRKNPAKFKIGSDQYVAWRGKIYIEINPKK